MDTLDAKLVAERTRLAALLSGLANALAQLSVEQLADVLPMVAQVDDIVRRVRAFGVPVSVPNRERVDPLPVEMGPFDPRFKIREW